MPAAHPTHPIEQSLARLSALRQPGYDFLLPRPDDQPGWISAARLAQPGGAELGELLGRVHREYPSKDRRPAAMLWTGYYVYPIQLVALGMFLMEGRLPDLSADQLCFRFGDKGWPLDLAWTGRRFAALPDDPAAGHPDCRVVPAATRCAKECAPR